PVSAALAGLIYAWMGRPADAERWAETADRWQRATPTDATNPAARAWSALLRAMLCRRGVEQMIADADEAARWFETGGIVTSGPAMLQGIGHVLRDDPDRGDGYLER